MTMTLDSAQQRYNSHMSFDYPSHNQPTTFSNPWPSSASPPSQPPSGQSSGMYMNGHHSQPMNPGLLAGKSQGRPAPGGSSSLATYGSMPVPGSATDLMNLNRLPPTSTVYGDAAYNASNAPVTTHYPQTSAPPFDTLGYAPAPIRPSFPSLPPAEPDSRRYSPSMMSMGHLDPVETPKGNRPLPPPNALMDLDHRGLQVDDRRGFADALDASHGMLAMSQETPRNIYGNRGDRSSIDSYGFPSTHSTSSSVSSSTFSSYYPESVSDYSTAGSDIESVTSRILPRPQGLMGSHLPPAPQSMMGQFSSKVSSSTQKKHKCKVCDKRFTRPSSLQTHMYSHTGEKPFACDVEGCGRHFSVVSNLRRHRKVHRGDARSDAGSEDHHSD